MLNKSIVLLLFGLLLFPSLASAEEEEDFVRTVLLGKSNLEIFEKELQNFDENMDIRGRSWFLKAVKSRGIRPKKLFNRRKDLTYVMEVSETDFVFTVSKESKSKYTVKIYDQGGEVVEELEVAGNKKGINQAGAAEVISVYATLVEVEEKAEEEVEEEVKIEEKSEVKVEKKEAVSEPKEKGSSKLSAEISVGLLKRDFEVDSPGGALLTYNSTFYPGGQLDIDYLIGNEASRPGVFFRAIGGLDSVVFEIDGERQVSSLLQIDAELGGFYSIEKAWGKSKLETRLLGGIRHTRFQIDDSALPSTSYSTINLGLSFLFDEVFPALSMGANLGFTPFGLFHDGARLFGESSFIYGFSAGLDGRYNLSDSLYLLGGFEMRNLRVSFSGAGESDFSDSDAFEMTQKINLGAGLKF